MSTIALGTQRTDVARLLATTLFRWLPTGLDGAGAVLQSVPVEAAEPFDQTDQADIRASLDGDGQAYARLVRRHQGALALRLRRFTRDAGALEELVQEVFVQAYYSLRSYKASAPFTHWLNRIATRVGYRYWKGRQRGATAVALEDWDGPAQGDDAGEARQAARELHRLMERLPPRDRLVLTLLYLEERSVADAARMAGWSQAMVKVQAFRARAKLRKLIEAHDAAEGRTQAHG